jgi:hypothetical protein
MRKLAKSGNFVQIVFPFDKYMAIFLYLVDCQELKLCEIWQVFCCMYIVALKCSR